MLLHCFQVSVASDENFINHIIVTLAALKFSLCLVFTSLTDVPRSDFLCISLGFVELLKMVDLHLLLNLEKF